MTSEARTAANQRNAGHSTGPKSPEGKRRSSQNALKHGMTSKEKEFVLPNENAEEFKDRLAHWNSYYQPSPTPPKPR